MTQPRRIVLTKKAAASRKPAPAPAPPVRRPTAAAGSTTAKAQVKRHTQAELREGRTLAREAHQTEVLDEREIDPSRMARIRFGAGLTINLGNYESARIDVQVEMPCDVDDLDSAFNDAAQFVSDRLSEEEARWSPESRS